MTKEKPGGRLALRVEGEWWVAYFAALETMDGAVELGRILLLLVEDSAEHKQGFMDLMQGCFSTALEALTGAAVERWNEPQRAPEHERSGRA